MTAVACSSCGADICVSNLHELKRTKATFYCPSGHSNWFPDGCEHERTLKNERTAWESTRQRFMRAVSEESQAARRCPWPTCRDYVYASRYGLYEHMQRQHAMPRLAAVREEESA